MNRKPRIGIDGRILQEKYSSGIPEYAYHVIKNMISDSPEYEFVIFFNSFRNIQNTIPKEILLGSEYKIFRFPNKALEWAWRFMPFPKIDKLLRVNYFFSPHFYYIPLSKSTNKTTTIHDLSFEKDKRYFSFRKNIWHYQMNPKLITKRSDKIIAVSESTKQDLISIYKTNENKIKMIPNGYDFDIKQNNISESEDNILNKWHLKKGEFILFLGTIEPRKNVIMAINAYNRSTNHEKKLVIAGKKGWLFEEITKTEKAKNNNIVFTGFVTNSEKSALLKNCYAFLFPAYYEGFGIPTIEAISKNKPVITSSVSSIPEVVGQCAILINPHCLSYYAKALDLMYDEKNYKSIVRRSSYSQITTWKEVAKKTLEYIVS